MSGSKVEVGMREMDGKGGKFWMGNCTLDVNILDTVFFFFPEKDGKPPVVVIETHKKEGK